jgi:hypothetical protein
MSEPVSAPGPVDPVGPAPAGQRDRLTGASPSTAVVPIGPVTTHARDLPPEASKAPDSAFAAQMMGQAGRKRGLKGGAPVLDEAKAAYLETEWSGRSDRRLAAGKMTKTDI